VDLKSGMLGDLKDGRYALQSPPAIFADVVITGSSNGEGSPSTGAYGDVRGWDAKTGKLRWTFHTVPRPGEPGADTWPANAWKNRSGTNVWGFFTVDAKRGIVYLPLGCPTSDFYGADRVGDGLYGNSLVALDARTGAVKWYRQLVHHDLWDYDLAAPPALFEIRRDGRVIPAVAQITKMGLLFVFDRVTGEPVYGIEERPVPQSTIPGEATAKTQPFPVKPPPLAKNTFRLEETYDRSPEQARFCKELFARNQMTIGPAYTPLPLEGNALFFPEHSRRRKLGWSIGRSVSRFALRQRYERWSVGPHGEARRRVRSHLIGWALRAFLESGDANPLPESALRRIGGR
jgi:glucose dehydrogenase